MNNELAKLKEMEPGIWGMMAGSTHPRTGKMILAEAEMLQLLEFVNLVPVTVEAAEARIAEQSAVIDQRNSECVRLINEKSALEAELAAIKGDQQPVKQLNIAGEHWMDVSDQKYRELSEERATVRTLYTHPAPAVLPPEIVRDDADGYWLYKGGRVSSANAAYYNQALRDAKALGAKPLTVIELPKKNIGWDRDGEDDCWNNAIDACAKAIRAAGLGVKS